VGIDRGDEPIINVGNAERASSKPLCCRILSVMKKSRRRVQWCCRVGLSGVE
jgi:hypothetical protein